MKYFLFICCILLSSCVFSTKEVGMVSSNCVRLSVQDTFGVISTGMGYQSGSTIITSAHISTDDRDIIQDGSGALWGRSMLDSLHDLAVYTKEGVNTSSLPVFPATSTGEIVFTCVVRSNEMQILTGSVVAPKQSFVGYTEQGKVLFIKETVLTDIPVELGDSGAPIWNTQGAVVGIVHGKPQKKNL